MTLLSGLQILMLIVYFLLIGSPVLSRPAIEKYNLKYRMDYSEKKLFCTAVLSLNNVKQGDTLNFLLYRLLTVKSVKDELGNDIKFTQILTAFSDWDILQVNHISVFTR